MPGFDGTGPGGMGPRTGGGFGWCPPGYGPAPYGGYGPVYGVGRGGIPRGGGRGRAWGGGRGWGWNAYAAGYAPPPYAPAWAPPSQGDELSYLADQEKALQEEMEAVRSRIEELKKTQAEMEK